MENENALGKRLFDIRSQRGETQETVAEAIGINCVSLSRYETGQRMPKMNILARLADHYGVTLDTILGREGKKPNTDNEKLLSTFEQLTLANRIRAEAYLEGLLASQEKPAD